VSALFLLAEAAESVSLPQLMHTPRNVVTAKSSNTSPCIQAALVFPRVTASSKPKRKTLLDKLPDNLTSGEGMRSMALRQVEKVRSFATREQKAKERYLKAQNSDKKKITTTKCKGKQKKKKQDQQSPVPSTSSTSPIPSTSSTAPIPRTSPIAPIPRTSSNVDSDDSEDHDATCMGCSMSWIEDVELGLGSE
jgi:hypothetical protein